MPGYTRFDRKVRKNTKRKVRKNTKRKVRKNTKRKNKIRHKRGGTEPPELVPTEIMNRSIVEISEQGGSIIKNGETSKTTVDWSTMEPVAPAGISVNFLVVQNESVVAEHVLLKVCKHGVDGIEKELTVGKEIGGIEGLIKPITLGYLGLVKEGHSDENLPAMIDRPDLSDKITWIESPRYYVMYKYIEGLTLLEFYNQILVDNYDDNTLSINRIISVIILDILYALRNIHGRGWVHNDLSLENIMITDYEDIGTLANGDYTKRPTITIIDLDACEECARTNTCMESQGPRVGFPKARAESLAHGMSFNGLLSDIGSVGIAFNRIFEDLSEVYPDNTYSVYDEVVEKLMEEDMNYSGVEDTIIITHQYITNNGLFPDSSYKNSVASGEAEALHDLSSPVDALPTEPVTQTGREALMASAKTALEKYAAAERNKGTDPDVLQQLKQYYLDAETLLSEWGAEEEDEEEDDGNNSDGSDDSF